MPVRSLTRSFAGSLAPCLAGSSPFPRSINDEAVWPTNVKGEKGEELVRMCPWMSLSGRRANMCSPKYRETFSNQQAQDLGASLTCPPCQPSLPLMGKIAAKCTYFTVGLDFA